ncbi:MAG TPA: cytochrome oxidase small assembly protein [Burkholderiaceae bacterium]|jgi:hypothetical protein
MQDQKQELKQEAKPSNLRTALVLASIAAVFFIGIFVKRIWFS